MFSQPVCGFIPDPGVPPFLAFLLVALMVYVVIGLISSIVLDHKAEAEKKATASEVNKKDQIPRS